MTEDPAVRTGVATRNRDELCGLVVFGAAAMSAIVWLFLLGRGLTFFYDEWDFVDGAATASFWHQVVQPHNGHPSMVPFSLYWVLLHTVGLHHYWPYQLLLTLIDVGCGLFLFLLLRRKVHPVVAAAAAAVLMLLGPAWQDLLWPFQIGFLSSVAAGLAALLLIDKQTARGDLGACACLLISVASSGVGLPFLAGTGVELLWRRGDWRRLWIPVVPLGLFVIWYEAIGKSATSSFALARVVHAMAEDTAATVGSLVGRNTTVGGVLSVGLGILVVVALLRNPSRASRLAMGVTGLASFWVLTLLARGTAQGSASRYLYPAAALVLVATGELPALLTRHPRRSQRTRRQVASPHWGRVATLTVVAVILGYSGIAIWWNASLLTANSDSLAAVSSTVRAELDAVVLAGPALPPNFRPDQNFMPQVQAGPFQLAAASFGWPAEQPASHVPDLPLGSTLDAMLLQGRPMTVASSNEPSSHSTGCSQRPIGLGASPTFTLPRAGVVVTAPAGTALDVRVRALSLQFPLQPVATIRAGSTAAIEWSNQRTAVHWQVELTSQPAAAAAGSVATVCTQTSA